MDRHAPLLSCRGLTKRFASPHGEGPGVLACRAVDFDVFPGRIHALLGENGAGKSTLMSLFSGWLKPDAGTILLSGTDLTLKNPAAALGHGIGMVRQHFCLALALSGAENLALALGMRPDARAANTLAERFGLALDPGKRVDEMSMGERQRLEILKLLARDAKVLILDEPTSVLSPLEALGLYAILRRLADAGRAVVVITHRLAEAAGEADEVSVMRRGRMIRSNLAPDGASADDLVRLMGGDEAGQGSGATKAARAAGETVLVARDLTGRGQPAAFSGIDLELRRGEILAIAGVAGNGQEALAATLAGVIRPVRGSLRLCGKPLARALTAYVPEDGPGAATVPGLTLAENMLLASGGERGGLLPRSRAVLSAERAIAAMDVKAPGALATAGELSGGNLQKFILARELAKGAPLLVAEQPTQGLDVQATAKAHAAILDAAKTAAVIVVTGDPAEALTLADRIAVIYRGRIAGMVDPGDPSASWRIGRLMAGLDGHGAFPPGEAG